MLVLFLEQCQAIVSTEQCLQLPGQGAGSARAGPQLAWVAGAGAARRFATLSSSWPSATVSQVGFDCMVTVKTILGAWERAIFLTEGVFCRAPIISMPSGWPRWINNQLCIYGMSVLKLPGGHWGVVKKL